MLPAFVAALCWIPAVVGLGSLMRHEGDAALRPSIAGLVGLGVAGTVGTLLNFFVPISPWLSAAMWLAGVALLVLRRRWLFEATAAWDAAVLVLVLAAATAAMRPSPFHYDSGFYHLQVVRWATEQSLFIGVANVHYRLALGWFWPLVGATLETPLTAGKSLFFLNQLPIVFAAAAALVGFRRLLAGDRSFPNLLLAAALLPAASATIGVGGLYVDYAAAIVAYLAIVLWARAVEAGDRFAAEALPAAALSVLASMLKVSGAVIPVAGLSLLVAWRAGVSRGAWLRLGVVTAVALVPWAVRGLLVSGCVAFPVAATCVGALHWGVPIEKVETVARVIGDWARTPGATPDGLRWLAAWPARVFRDYPEAYLLSSALAAGAVLLVVRRGRWSRAFVTVLLVAGASVAFWFLSAPDPRFGLGPLYALGLAPLLFGVSAGAPVPEGRGVRVAVAAVLLAASLALGVVLSHQERIGMTFGLPPLRRHVLRWPPIPRLQVLERTNGAVRVNVPDAGECCWAEPIPCAPEAELDPRLRFDGYYFIEGGAGDEVSRSR